MKLYFCHHWVDLPVAPPKLLYPATLSYRRSDLHLDGSPLYAYWVSLFRVQFKDSYTNTGPLHNPTSVPTHSPVTEYMGYIVCIQVEREVPVCLQERQTGDESGDPRYFHQFIARDRGHDQMGARRVAGQGPQGLMSSTSDSPVLYEISEHATHNQERPCPPKSPWDHVYIVYRAIGHEMSPQQAICAKRSKTAQNGKKKDGRPVFRKKLYLRKLQREKKIQGTCAEREVLRLSFNRYHTHVNGQQHVVLESGRARKLKDQCNPVPH
ncbi:hypothetical protein DFH09DRAFT_1098611 [Mycena vulgaris]|nr:hypothetical protein DFH09DRAFT_1098611 [Mycena vulgaris]